MRKSPKKTVLSISLVVLAIGILVLADIFIFQSVLIYKYRGPGPDYPERLTEVRLLYFRNYFFPVITHREVDFVELQEMAKAGEITPEEIWEHIAMSWRELYGNELFYESLTDGWGQQFVVDLQLVVDERYDTAWELFLRSKGPSGIDHGGKGDDIVYGPLRFWVFDRWRYFMEWPRGPQGTERGEIVERIDAIY